MILPFVIAAICIAADQISKYFLAPWLSAQPSQTFPIIRDVLHLTYLENRGAAFGMLADHRWVFMALSVVGIAAIVVLLAVEKPKSAWVRTAVGLVLGGGIGNMIDRVRLGYVVDFIDCRFINFYIFNIADACVTVGCALYFVLVVISEIRAAKRKKAAAADGDDARTDADASDVESDTDKNGAEADAPEQPEDGSGTV